MFFFKTSIFLSVDSLKHEELLTGLILFDVNAIFAWHYLKLTIFMVLCELLDHSLWNESRLRNVPTRTALNQLQYHI